MHNTQRKIWRGQIIPGLRISEDIERLHQFRIFWYLNSLLLSLNFLVLNTVCCEFGNSFSRFVPLPLSHKNPFRALIHIWKSDKKKCKLQSPWYSQVSISKSLVEGEIKERFRRNLVIYCYQYTFEFCFQDSSQFPKEWATTQLEKLWTAQIWKIGYLVLNKWSNAFILGYNQIHF